MFRNVFKVGGVTVVSRILGLIRDTLSANVLGASVYSDAFFIAFKLPNVFRKLFAEGSLNSVFIPIFTGLISTKGEKEAREFANEIFSVLFFSLLVIILVMEFFMPQVLIIIAPGFKNKFPEAYNLAVNLTRISLPYLFFISIATLFSSILNSLKKFTIAAMLPVVLNICLILAFLWGKYSGSHVMPEYIASFAITLAGVLQAVIIAIYAKKQGWSLRFIKINKMSKSAKEFFKRVVPVIFTAGIYQINVFIDITIASWLASGAITYLYYGDRLNQLPLALIGIATSTVIIPFIAGKASSIKERNQIKCNALLYGVVLGLPAVLGFIILGHEIVTILFKHGKFTASSVDATYYVLCAYALGLIPNILIKIAVAIFYAESDSNTPFYINFSILIVNTVLAIIFAYWWGYLGIAVATSVSSFISVTALLTMLIKRKLLILNYSVIHELIKNVIAVVIIFVIVIAAKYLLLNYFSYQLGKQKLWFSLSFISLMIITVIMYVVGLKLIQSKLYLEIAAMFKKEK